LGNIGNKISNGLNSMEGGKEKWFGKTKRTLDKVEVQARVSIPNIISTGIRFILSQKLDEASTFLEKVHPRILKQKNQNECELSAIFEIIDDK
jgi:hypothetical protein